MCADNNPLDDAKDAASKVGDKAKNAAPDKGDLPDPSKLGDKAKGAAKDAKDTIKSSPNL
jgi:hypothetical protein